MISNKTKQEIRRLERQLRNAEKGKLGASSQEEAKFLKRDIKRLKNKKQGGSKRVTFFVKQKGKKQGKKVSFLARR